MPAPAPAGILCADCPAAEAACRSSPFPESLWLAETLRLSEARAGTLEDAEACRQARAGGGDLRQRLLVRARWLAQRDGLDRALGHWRQGAALALALLAALALGSGAGLALAALGDGSRPVNLLWRWAACSACTC